VRLHRWILLLVAVMMIGSCAGPGLQPDRPASTATTTTTSLAPSSTTPTTATSPTTSTTHPSTSTTEPSTPVLPAGLLCRHLQKIGYGFGEALAYWVREGAPQRMDADNDGIPCETVYPAHEVEATLEFETGEALGAGRLCRDVKAGGHGFDAALAYWIREGRPTRMDADDNGLPCESVYSWQEILSVMAFDGAAFVSPPPLRGVPVSAIVADVQRRLQAAWDAQTDRPEGVLGPFRVECAGESARMRTGDVFACAGVPQTITDVELDPVGVVFLVLDDHGAVSSTWGTDVPDSTGVLIGMFDEVGDGLTCRDLVDTERGGFFSAHGGTPAGNYFNALLYWFLDGMPDRMDADRDGIPCETLFPKEAIDTVWNGGALADDA
jgi:hypothetical protein